jgi:small multidrug resistance pump
MRGLDILLYIVFTVAGLVLMKIGAKDTIIGFNGSILDVRVSYIIVLGFLCYVTSFIMYIGLLKRYPLVFIQPFTIGIVFLLTILAGVFILKESINIGQILGAVLVIAGVLLVSLNR